MLGPCAGHTWNTVFQREEAFHPPPWPLPLPPYTLLAPLHVSWLSSPVAEGGPSPTHADLLDAVSRGETQWNSHLLASGKVEADTVRLRQSWDQEGLGERVSRCIPAPQHITFDHTERRQLPWVMGRACDG